ncbi:hypothetical protein G6F40_013916 [Rhizopus arrhizus]|nr:hypothetical protein G6F40_013916 [Rhizopus arrhizus]
MPDHQHVAHALHARHLHRVVHIGFQRNGAASPPAFVGGDDGAGAAVAHAGGDGGRRESTEHDVMHGADARAGQHGGHGVHDHRHVARDAVAAADADA